MLKVNDKNYEWHADMTIYDLFTTMGYTLRKPPVLITVNNELVSRTEWDICSIPENSIISVVNLLRGG